MKIIINNTSMTPIYEQIIDQIKKMIVKGELKENDSLPSVRSLSNELKISALTVKKAYDFLENEGYIDKYIKVIYQNIILFLILILLAFILPIKNDNKLLSILVILVYTFITFIYIKLQKRKG